MSSQDHGQVFCNNLPKTRLNNYKDHFDDITRWVTAQNGRSHVGAWASDTLAVDLNLPVTNTLPESIAAHLLLVAEGRLPILLSLTCARDREVKLTRRQKNEVDEYTIEMARELKSSLVNFCDRDFAIIRFTLDTEDVTEDRLNESYQKGLWYCQMYYGGPVQLDSTTVTDLKEAITILSGVSPVPAFLQDPQGTEEQLLLLDDGWRKVLHLAIEELTRKHEHCQVTCNRHKHGFKTTVALMEAARRLGFRQDVVIVTADESIRRCVKRIKAHTDTEFKIESKLRTKELSSMKSSKQVSEVVIFFDCDPSAADRCAEESDIHKHVDQGAKQHKKSPNTRNGMRNSDCSSGRTRNPSSMQARSQMKTQRTPLCKRKTKRQAKEARKRTLREMDQKGCSTCDGLLRCSEKRIVFHIGDHLFEDILGNDKRTPQEARQEKLNAFFQAVNALLNEGGGVVYIHADAPHYLGLFDEKVDSKLKTLIPDDTCFAENFERHFHDERHISFRVIGSGRPPSTLNFNSKVSLNKGLEDPTQSQMRRLFGRGPQRQGARPREELVLWEHREVKVKRRDEARTWSYVFQEGIAVQAKRVPSDVWNGDTERSTEKLADYCWKQVSPYITAFSKLPHGGSLYFGIYEKKDDSGRRWSPYRAPRDIENWARSLGRGFRVWKDRSSGMFHITEQRNVPRIAQKKTGQFYCEGVYLDQSQRDYLKRQILDRVFTDMLWLAPSDPDTPVTVQYHEVRGSCRHLCVVEIAVKYVQGLCFFDKRGPLSYKLPGRTMQPEPLKPGEWVRVHGGRIQRESTNVITFQLEERPEL